MPGGQVTQIMKTLFSLVGLAVTCWGCAHDAESNTAGKPAPTSTTVSKYTSTGTTPLTYQWKQNTTNSNGVANYNNVATNGSNTSRAGDVLSQRYEEAIKKLTEATTEQQRFHALDSAAKESFVVGKIEDAREYADQLTALAPKFTNDWNYGNAVQDANLVLGRIAIAEGHMDEAKHRLLEAGKSPGSPTMNSFGPNLSLARDLLEKGQHDEVLVYLELCRKFWADDFGKLDTWKREINEGKIPDFGPNLIY